MVWGRRCQICSHGTPWPRAGTSPQRPRQLCGHRPAWPHTRQPRGKRSGSGAKRLLRAPVAVLLPSAYLWLNARTCACRRLSGVSAPPPPHQWHGGQNGAGNSLTSQPLLHPGPGAWLQEEIPGMVPIGRGPAITASPVQ